MGKFSYISKTLFTKKLMKFLKRFLKIFGLVSTDAGLTVSWKLFKFSFHTSNSYGSQHSKRQGKEKANKLACAVKDT